MLFPSRPHRLARSGKVFGIGLSGTGTLSLCRALQTLGYRARHFPQSLEDFDRYDALADTPVACRYRELDRLFPNSKFILTVRARDSWLETRQRKPADRDELPLWTLETRLKLYDCVQWRYDRERLAEAWTRHHAGVREHFRDREQDLLELDIVGGAGWAPLCAFLGLAVPEEPFPWEHRHVYPEGAAPRAPSAAEQLMAKASGLRHRLARGLDALLGRQ